MGFASVPSETRLKEWISRYSDDVLRTCFVLLSDQSLAEDAMQDTFTKAWKNMSQFEGRENASPKTWLMRIAVNTCKDYRRTQWLRHRNQTSPIDELPEAVRFAHDHGVRVHVTVNTMPRNDEVARLPEHLERLNDLGVDALILADLGAFTLAGRYAPRCERHISTQQSIANYECARAWYDLGAKRVVLAREVSLQEIREMREKLPPELELETFCHGAMCVSYSGRCLLSNYMTGRDSNRGACAQPCRYQYALMEEKRPGEYFPVFEDEKGTYIMNSRDMCMIGHLDDIMDAGIDCIKIEGRAKSEYYAAIVTGAYRHVLDEVAAGETPDPVWLDEVEHVSHRHYSTGFYYGQPGQYYDNSRYIRDWQVVAVVESCDANGMATFSLRNKFRAGDTVEVVGPDCKPFPMVVPEMRDAEGFTLLEPRNPRMVFTMQLPRSVPAMSFVRHAVDLSARN